MATAPRRFFDRQPSSWQELELLVEQAFSEMLYESHRGYMLPTVRGKVAIDVYAVKRSAPIPIVVLCECKHWTKPVEQTVVHGFRSVCADAGAHIGLIISKAGFQSGASVTREATNVHLLDFSSFQETFFGEWRTGVFMTLAHLSDALSPLIFHRFMEDTDHLASKLRRVNPFQKYDLFFGEHKYTGYFVEDGSLPVEVIDPRGDPRDQRKVTISSYREFFEIATQGAADARAYFAI